MPQVIGFAVLAGLLSSALFLALSTGLPGMVLLAYFVQLPLLLAGLSLGLAASVLAAAAAILVCGLIAGVVAAAMFALVQAIPAAMVVRQALLSRAQAGQLEWYPPGLVLAQLTVLAVLGITAAFVVLLGHPGGLEGVLADFLSSALAGLGATDVAVSAGPDLERWMFLFPGLMAGSWLVMVAVNAVLAQLLAVRLGVNRRPSPRLSELELPGWLWPAIGVAALLALLGAGGLGFLGRSLLIVLAVPYVFLGLAVVHAFAHRVTHRRLALTLFYGAIMLLGWPIVAVLLLGFVEDWAHVRQRFL
jgi:Predicted membrane protein (DUF2232)